MQKPLRKFIIEALETLVPKLVKQHVYCDHWDDIILRIILLLG